MFKVVIKSLYCKMCMLFYWKTGLRAGVLRRLGCRKAHQDNMRVMKHDYPNQVLVTLSIFAVATARWLLTLGSCSQYTAGRGLPGSTLIMSVYHCYYSVSSRKLQTHVNMGTALTLLMK